MRTTILTLLIALFSNCSRDKTDLGDSYYYLDSFEAVDVGYPEGAIIYKSKTKNVFTKTIISKEVVQATSNNLFILAKQIAKDNRLDTNYFIIDKMNEKVYGPLTVDSYQTLKRNLKTEK